MNSWPEILLNTTGNKGRIVYLVRHAPTKNNRADQKNKKFLLAESHPVEVAEFAKARCIDREPAFAWWVPYTLRKRDVILSAVKKRIRKTTHKYGIEIPTSVEHAFEIDRRNDNTLWRDAIKKEMFNVGVAFEIQESGCLARKPLSVGAKCLAILYSMSRCHSSARRGGC